MIKRSQKIAKGPLESTHHAPNGKLWRTNANFSGCQARANRPSRPLEPAPRRANSTKSQAFPAGNGSLSEPKARWSDDRPHPEEQSLPRYPHPACGHPLPLPQAREPAFSPWFSRGDAEIPEWENRPLLSRSAPSRLRVSVPILSILSKSHPRRSNVLRLGLRTIQRVPSSTLLQSNR